MDSDSFDERLGAALKDKGARSGAVAAGDDVRRRIDGRAATLRRRRTTGRAVAMALIALLVVSAAVLPRRGGGDDVVSQVAAPDGTDATTTTRAPVEPTFVVPLPGPMNGWAGEVAAGTITLPSTETYGPSTAIVHPYVVVPIASGYWAHPLDGDRWTTSETSWTRGAVPMAEEPGSTIAVQGRLTVVNGQGFDPSRLRRIAGPPFSASGLAGGTPVDATVRQVGELRFVATQEMCPPVTGAFCTVIGGTDDFTFQLFGTLDPAMDLDTFLGSWQFADEATWRAAITPMGVTVAPMAFAMEMAAPAAMTWPAEVPADFCTAYRDFQAKQNEAYAADTAGYVRWADRLAELAPPQLRPRFELAARARRDGTDPQDVEVLRNQAAFMVESDQHCGTTTGG